MSLLCARMQEGTLEARATRASAEGRRNISDARDFLDGERDRASRRCGWSIHAGIYADNLPLAQRSIQVSMGRNGRWYLPNTGPGTDVTLCADHLSNGGNLPTDAEPSNLECGDPGSLLYTFRLTAFPVSAKMKSASIKVLEKTLGTSRRRSFPELLPGDYSWGKAIVYGQLVSSVVPFQRLTGRY
jgi:hypothetical protein